MFRSTRTAADDYRLGFLDAFATGLAADGGLLVPESLPALPPDLLAPEKPTPYPELAKAFFRSFLGGEDDGLTPDELDALIDHAYASFRDPKHAAPLRRLDDRTSVLELFHGPTLAFKDFGLQLVGQLFGHLVATTGQPVNVLGATSGDTGAAAIHGLAGREGVNVFILYPEGRVSPLQERQMTCTGASNIYPIAIGGSFDDAQHIIKDLFGDLAFKESLRLSAVNSINVVRVLAQAVYYLSASQQLTAGERERTRFVVPTGNFGNILAGWIASRMGMDAKGFVIATNQNDILYRLFTTGRYEPGNVHPSLAPSMDIQVASNFERFLFYMTGGDHLAVGRLMAGLRGEGAVNIPAFDPDTFSAGRTDDAGIVRTIADIHERFGYTVDPHTACGFAALEPGRETHDVVLATAHPAKFPETLERAIGNAPTHPTLEALRARTPRVFRPGSDAAAIRDFVASHGA